MAQVRLARPPARVNDYLTAAFDDWASRRAAARRAESPLRRLVATLAFDGSAGAALAGARGGATAPEMVSFTSDVCEIVCHLLGPEDGRWSLDGQVLPSSEDGSASPDAAIDIEIVTGDNVVATVEADEFGEFSVAGLAAGSYSLVVRDGRHEVVAGPFPVPPAAQVGDHR